MNLPEVGHVLGGKYEIIRLLGEGGMGAVFEAENKLTRKRVAIKWLLPEVSGGSAAARLLREAQAASRVRHSNVVDVYDVEREGDAIFLVMELLEGETLKRTMSRHDLAMHALIALLIPALRGVAAAHRQGVIHRDIKPENIFLAREDEDAQPVPKVLDFGISKVEERGALQPSLTRTGSTVGTPLYMSYEQLAGDRSIDGRADVYAFGVILYEGLTGRLPFDAENMPKLVVKIATEVAPTPRSLRADIPASLSRVIMRAIARQRDERTPSVEILARELEPFASEQGFTAALLRSDDTSPELKAEGHAPLDAKTGFLSQATKANTVQPAFAATHELASPAVADPNAAPERRPYPLFGTTQRRQRFAPTDLSGTGTAADIPPTASPLRSTPPRLKASTERSARRPFWIGALVAAFILPLGFRLLRGPKPEQQAEAAESPPAANEAKATASDPRSPIPTTPSTRSADATEHDWDPGRPVQITYDQPPQAANAGNTQQAPLTADASTPPTLDSSSERPRRSPRAARPDAGLVRTSTSVAASTSLASPIETTTPAIAKPPEPPPAVPNPDPATFRVRPPKAQEF